MESRDLFLEANGVTIRRLWMGDAADFPWFIALFVLLCPLSLPLSYLIFAFTIINGTQCDMWGSLCPIAPCSSSDRRCDEGRRRDPMIAAMRLFTLYGETLRLELETRHKQIGKDSPCVLERRKGKGRKLVRVRAQVPNSTFLPTAENVEMQNRGHCAP